MESTRQKKVARLVQKELANLFLTESKTLFWGAFITVTNVRISPDLSYAKVYLSLFKAEKPQEMIDQINEMRKEIRKRLGELIRKQLRIIPDIEFFLDDSLDYFEKIDRLLKNS